MRGTQYIDDQQTWNQVGTGLLELPVLALDTEANNSHVYYSRVCLVQIGTTSGEFIVDPLAVKDLSLLGRALQDASILKVVHSASNDLAWLDRDFGFTCQSLFDTEVAGRLLGRRRPNLGALVEHFLGIHIPKDPAIQRSNWALRPLGQAELEYAAKDVRYLTSLAVAQKRELEAKGRIGWALEEFRRVERVRHVAVAQPDDAFLRIKGSYRLNPRHMAVLRELYALREQEAERQDQPPFRIMNSQSLLALAQYPRPNGEQRGGLRQVGNTAPPQDAPSWLMAEIADAIERGWSGPEYDLVTDAKGARGRTSEQNSRFEQLKRLFADYGEELDMDPLLLWPTVSLERMAIAPETWRLELYGEDVAEVRDWQRETFGEALADLCASPEWQAGDAKWSPA